MADSNTGLGVTSVAASPTRGSAAAVAAVELADKLAAEYKRVPDFTDQEASYTFPTWGLEERLKVIKELDLLFPSDVYDRSVFGPGFINMEVTCELHKSNLDWILREINNEIEILKWRIKMGLPAIDHGDGGLPRLDELEEFLGQQERYKMAMSNKATAEDKK